MSATVRRGPIDICGFVGALVLTPRRPPPAVADPLDPSGAGTPRPQAGGVLGSPREFDPRPSAVPLTFDDRIRYDENYV